MSIQNIKDSKELQKYCETLGREGMYQRVIQIASQIQNEATTPQQVMMYAGEIKAIAIGSKCDTYWSEKVHHGYYRFLGEAEFKNKHPSQP
jgi:hypothetical protein